MTYSQRHSWRFLSTLAAPLALTGVGATSAASAWAVGIGSDDGSAMLQTLILHWDGTKWTRVASPNLGSDNGLLGVAATSPNNAWAVGGFNDNGPGQPWPSTAADPARHGGSWADRSGALRAPSALTTPTGHAQALSQTQQRPGSGLRTRVCVPGGSLGSDPW